MTLPISTSYYVSRISIHTPTQGVTPPAVLKTDDLKDFNPHSHAGSDLIIARRASIKSDFNPHSHAGSDLLRLESAMYRYNFNPHSHAGSDLNGNHLQSTMYYFNPHSHAGSDYAFLQKGTGQKISIHTPTQGVTSKIVDLQLGVGISIHTPTQGVTILTAH